MISRAEYVLDVLKTRRTVRDFSDQPVPLKVIEDAVKTAAMAPNGANKQPWHFVIVSDPEMKKKIRLAAEEEEKAFYDGRASEEWLEALEPLGTDAQKPFLETAPYLIVVFQQNYGVDEDGKKVKHYYVHESVGIASGFLLATLHAAGLATLTHTPSPMGFLREILGRPANERATMIVVAGCPADGAQVPDISKKSFDEICTKI
jgi:nitroreductase